MTSPTPPERDALIAEVEARHQRNRESFRMDTPGGVPQLPGPLSDNDLYVAAMADVPALLAQLRADAEKIARLKLRLGNLTEFACQAQCRLCQALEPVHYTKHLYSGVESWFHKSGICQASAIRFALTPGAPDAR